MTRRTNAGGEGTGTRWPSVLGRAVSLAMMGSGLILVALFLLGFPGNPPGSGATTSGDPDAPGGASREEERDARAGTADGGPEDKTLTVTIPEMNRVREATVPTAAGDNERALRANAAIHLRGTGLPWQRGANVYLAGHVLGYPGTDSFLAFHDQRELGEGDQIRITDSEGREYVYEVFEEFMVGPTDTWVTQPVDGKSILTLQTCTLPSYQDRLITRAELVDGP